MRRHIARQLSHLSEAFIDASTSNNTIRSLTARFSSLAYDIETLTAERREGSGSSIAAKLRHAGRIPGILFSLPEEDAVLLSFDKNDIATQMNRLGRTGWACRVFNIEVPPAEGGTGGPTVYRALGRQVHLTAASDVIENVTLMHCPPERHVRINVPLRVYGEEVCPGLKAGGRINWIQRTVACVAQGDAIPQEFEIDISHLHVNDKLLYTDVTLPEGVELAVADPEMPLLKIMRK